jgi:hypothetical protein
MTFLELCQMTAREAGIAGEGPPTVRAQVGEMANVIRWVSNAYSDIQSRNNGQWNWLRNDFFLFATLGIQEYGLEDIYTVDEFSPLTDRFSAFLINDVYNPPKIILNEYPMDLIYYTYTDMRWLYYQKNVPDNTPVHIAETPDQRLWIGPATSNPIDQLVLGEYWKGPQTLELDDDIPEMPHQFHRLIVWYALEEYGDFETAGDVSMRAAKNRKRMMRQLENNQQPEFRKAGAMA